MRNMFKKKSCFEIFIQKMRIKRKKHERFVNKLSPNTSNENLKLIQGAKTLAKFLLKIFGWILLFCAGGFIASLVDTKASFGAIIFAYIIFLVCPYYNLKQYKNIHWWKTDNYPLNFALIFLLSVFDTAIYLTMLLVIAYLQNISLQIIDLKYSQIKKDGD